MARVKSKPRCIVIAGPNGAGKTTFARRYLPESAGVLHFVNADLIASGLSPLEPELAAIAAARLVLQEIDRLAAERRDFAFETTCSGLGYVRRIRALKDDGYVVEMVYLRLRSVHLALRRVAASVSTARWLIAGLCMTTRSANQNLWRRVHEHQGSKPLAPGARVCSWRRACIASRCEGRSKGGAHVRYAAVRLGRRQSGGQEAVGPGFFDVRSTTLQAAGQYAGATGRNQTRLSTSAPSGGSVSVSEQGCSCSGSATASSVRPLPLLLPPYHSESELRITW